MTQMASSNVVPHVKKREHALVLSGGASRGSWQLGYAEGLIEVYGSDYEPDVYVGTSVGGLMAAVLAMYPTFAEGVQAYAGLWLRRVKGNSSIYKTWWPSWLGPLACLPALWKGSLYTAKPLRNLIREEFRLSPVLNSGKGLRLTVVDLLTGFLRLYDERTLPGWKEVYATAAFPLGFEPIWLETFGFNYGTDGGVRDVTPLKAGIETGASQVDVLWTAVNEPMGTWARPDGVTRLYAIARRKLDIVLDEAMNNDINVCHKANQRIMQGRGDDDHRLVKLRVWRPRRHHVGSSLDFSPEKWQANRKLGRSAALNDHGGS